jgi:dUTPase
LRPLPPGTWGLLLGRSSIIIKGLQISSGVIDNDHEGETKIMAASHHGIITVLADKEITQLILVPCICCLPNSLRMRENKVALVLPMCTGFNLLPVRDLIIE